MFDTCGVLVRINIRGVIGHGLEIDKGDVGKTVGRGLSGYLGNQGQGFAFI